MKVYLVGGAVRDHVMGRPVSDRDYVVVGSSVEQMLALGYKQVGADFPVFLHPETGEEYALARQERKTGRGYNGFEAIFDEHTTLIDDLRRRDLTMNAMAMDVESGEIIDPYNGQRDIKDNQIAATSDAFAEDPVRVLRAARFAAKYNFKVNYNTVLMVGEMIARGELEHLTSERVFKELEKALQLQQCDKFFATLWEMDALRILFPELQALEGVPAGPERYHGEGDSLTHTMMVLAEASQHNNSLIKFGALVHDLGKAVTPKETLPSHPGHEEAGVPIVEALCHRLRMPSAYKRVGMLCARHHGHVHKTFEMSGKSFVKIYKDFNKGYFHYDVDILVKVAEADHFGRISIDNAREKGYPEAEVFKKVITAIHGYRLSQDVPVDVIKTMDNERIQQVAHQGRCRVAKTALREAKELAISQGLATMRQRLEMTPREHKIASVQAD